MRAIFFSGGGTKGIAQRGFADELRKHGITGDVYGGVSIGACNAFIEATGTHEKGTELFKNIDENLLWGHPYNAPNKLFGGVRGVRSMVTSSKPYLGIMKGYEAALRNLITMEVFDEYQMSEDTPDCYVLAARSDGEAVWWNLKDQAYEDAIKCVIASGSIPIMTPPVFIWGSYYWDGGLVSHNPGDFLLPYLKEQGHEITEVISHYTRPKGAVMSEKNLMDMGLGEAVMQMIAIYNANTTKEDEEDENEFCKDNNIPYFAAYTPYFSSGFYDTTKESAEIGYNLGTESAHTNYLNLK